MQAYGILFDAFRCVVVLLRRNWGFGQFVSKGKFVTFLTTGGVDDDIDFARDSLATTGSWFNFEEILQNR